MLKRRNHFVLILVLGGDPTAHHDANQEYNQEHEEQDLRNTRCGACNSTKAQQGGDQRDDQKYPCVVQH